MKNYRLLQNPYLLFSPFLLIFLVYILLNPSDFIGDEERYVRFANNILKGFYSPPAPHIDLTNGPGYPLLLVPFLACGVPLKVVALSNAFFYYISIVLLYKALKDTVHLKLAVFFSFFWACYYVAYQYLNTTVTEVFSFLLISMLIYSLVKCFNTDNIRISTKYILLAGFTMGFIALTKMIFGYVLLFMFFGQLIIWISDIKNINYRKGLYVLIVSLITVTPYLVYTYNLTGRIYYWGFGKDSLYWMSTPYEDEYGDWKQELVTGTIEMNNFNIPCAGDTLKDRHEKDFNEIYKYSGIERDDAFKNFAIKNIKGHPFKFAKNWVYNVGRLFFHFPFSYARQRPKVLLIFPINGIILTLILYSLIPTFVNWHAIPYNIKYLLFYSTLYLGASSLVSAQVRMLTIIMPVYFLWFAYIIQKSLIVKIKFK